MALERKRIGLREVRALKPHSELFDGGPGSVPGFGVRRRAGSAVSYFIMFRTAEGRQRRFTIGTHGAPWTPDTARDKALAVLTAARVDGSDPAAEKREKRQAATVAESRPPERRTTIFPREPSGGDGRTAFGSGAFMAHSLL